MTSDGSTGPNVAYLNRQAAYGNFVSGEIALQQGFLLIAIIWSSIAVFVIDWKLKSAATASMIAAALSAIGLMHGYRLENGTARVEVPLLNRLSGDNSGSWLGAPRETAGYLIAALIFGLFYALGPIKGGQDEGS